MKRRLLVFASILLAALLLVACKGKEYDVTFDLDGGVLAELVSPVKVKEGKKVDNPGTPTKDGHEFDGWYLGNAEYDFDAAVTKDITIKARWEEESVDIPDDRDYQVAFDVNHPDAGYVKSQKVASGETAKEPAAPAIEFYDFAGWYLGDDLYDFATPVTENLVLVAKWDALTVLNVSYKNVEAGEFRYGTREQMLEGFLEDLYEFINPEDITLDRFKHSVLGNDYAGAWHAAATGLLYDGSVADLSNLDNATFATSVKYGPKWYGFFEFMDSWIKRVNSAQYFWDNGTPSTYVGMIRLRQYVVGENPGNLLLPENVGLIPDELIAYKPAEKFTEEYGLAALPVPFRELHAFVGWYDNEELEGEPVTALEAGLEEDVVLYAKWRELELYEVQFDLNYDGADEIDPEDLYETHLVPRPESPVREGYIFGGWKVEVEEELVAYDFAAKLEKDLVIKAEWLEAVVVTLDFDNGDDDAERIIVKGTKLAEPDRPVKESAAFEGWFIEGEEDPFDFDTEITEDITLVAHWKELVEHAITYNLNGGEIVPYETRHEMIMDFLTDYFAFIAAYPDIFDISEMTLEEFIGYDPDADPADFATYGGKFPASMSLLVENADMSVDINSTYFVKQLAYNKWAPLVRAMETYAHVGNPDQHLWGIADVRVGPFINQKDLWGYHNATDTAIIHGAMNDIPLAYQELVNTYNEQDSFDLAIPVKEDAIFLGWYDNEDLDGEPIFAIVPNEEAAPLELYAGWEELDVVSVTLKLYDEEQRVVNILRDSLFEEPADPVRYLYEFEGWLLDGEPYDFDNEVEEDIILVAKWNKLDSVEVTFDADNDEDPVVVERVKGDVVPKPVNPRKDRHDFEGWFLPDATEAFDFDTELDANITLKAKWDFVYEITYNLNGGSLEVDQLVELYGKGYAHATFYNTIDWSGGNVVVRDTLVGAYWFALALKETEYDGVYEYLGQGVGYSNPEADIYVNYHDGILAQYKADVVALYAAAEEGDFVIFDSLPEAAGSGKAIDIHLLKPYDAEVLVVRYKDVTELLVPVLYGKDIEWYAEEALTTKVTELPATTTEDLEYFAKWVDRPVHEVTFDFGYDGSPEAEVVDAIERYPVDPITKPVREGYRFEGWLLDDEAYDFDALITKDITLVADWYKYEIYEVTFKVDAEDENPTVVEVYEDHKVATPANPVKEGKIFDAWYLVVEDEDDVVYNFNNLVVEDIVLVAKWIDAVTVTYVVDEGLEVVVKVAKGERVPEPAAPVKVDHKFMGWFEEGKEVPFNFDNALSANVKVVAKWEVLPVYSIEYEPNGGQFTRHFAVREEMLDAVLKDFYDYVKPTEDLVTFMHGAGNTEGYNGTWHSEHKAKIYAGPRPTEVNNALFVSHELYMDKWLPFFDAVDDYVVAVNPDQAFWAAGTYVGFLRIVTYFTKTANLNPAMDIIPEEYILIDEYNADAEPFALPEVVKAHYDFLGWYDNEEFEGEPIVELDPLSDKNLKFYAKWGGRVTIEEMLAKEDKEEGIITGIITNLGPYNSFSMEDDTGAIAFRIGGKNAANAGLEVGDEVIAKVKKNTYNGLIQGELSGDMEILSQGNDLPALVDLNGKSLKDADLLEYQSRIIKLDDVEVVSHEDVGYGTIEMMVKSGDEQVLVRVDNRSVTEAELAIIAAIEVGDVFSINGATITWFNKAQVMIDSLDQLVFPAGD